MSLRFGYGTAVGGGFGAVVPLRSALVARAGSPVGVVVMAALAPLARCFGRGVSIT